MPSYAPSVRVFRIAFLLLACGCDGSPPPCVDTDLDGYGPGCAAGEDCDPDNAARNYDCTAVPAPDCAADPTAAGCPCLPGAIVDCLTDRAGVGLCRAGRAVCVNEHFGLCEGGVAPSGEYCDGLDQDCDGRVDEGVVSPCGGCNSACTGGVWGEGAAPFEPSAELALTRFGELTLASREQVFPFVWVANSAEGTLSRIDADRAIETARYSSGGAEPSRVAVDYAGDAWVVNRELDGAAPSVRKVAGALARCIDRDGDGVETSTGPGDVRSDDECVLLQAEVGEAGAVARAIAIDGDRGLDAISGGDAWIGLHDAEAIVEVDGFTGELKTRLESPGFRPYAASFDPWGTLWMISRDGLLARIDPRAHDVEILEVPLPCYLLYGIAIDRHGRILMTGFSCDRLVSYDPALDRWTTGTLPASPRGAVFGADGFWVAHTGGRMSEVALDPLRVRRTLGLTDDAVSPIETIGAAYDARGRVWGVSSRGGAGGVGLATRLDPASGAVTAQVPVGRGPHVQGDLTGARVRHVLVPRGSATHVFRGCGDDEPTEWLRVHVAAALGSNGRVILEARHAARESELASASFVRLGAIPDEPAPYALAFPEGGVVEVRLTLDVDGVAGAPRVRRVGLEWRCPGPI